VPRPGPGPLFPLTHYLDPAPALRFSDEPDLLDDQTRPLVLYGLSGPVVIHLGKDRSPGTDSVRIWR